MISTLRDIASSHIADGCKNSDMFTLMIDRSTDNSNEEMKAVVSRCVGDTGDIEEHLLTIENVSDRSAQGIMNMAQEGFFKYQISFDSIVSQTYDSPVATLANQDTRYIWNL